jgi:hypothetical protein
MRIRRHNRRSQSPRKPSHGQETWELYARCLKGQSLTHELQSLLNIVRKAPHHKKTPYVRRVSSVLSQLEALRSQ